jgi:hypothetical protein
MKKRQGDIEHRDHQSQTNLNRRLQAMMDPLEVAHDGHHRQGCVIERVPEPVVLAHAQPPLWAGEERGA